MILQNTTHWHTGSRKPPIVIIVASDTPRLNELIARVDDLLHSLSRLLELTLILIAIVLAGMEVAVSLCNRLYGACVKADRQLDLYIENMLNACMSFYIGFEKVAMRGIG